MRRLLQFWLTLRSYFTDVWGVTVYDYNNGDPNLVGNWNALNWEKFEAVMENFLTNGRDGVYFLCYKQGNNIGYFEVASSTGKYFTVAFRGRQYDAVDAYRDAMKKSREFADHLGFVKRSDEIPTSDIREGA